MQNKNVMQARLGDKLEFYDSFSHYSSFVFSLILTCMISFENGLKSQIQWYNNWNNEMKTIEMTKLWTSLPSNHLKPQMYDSVSFSRNEFRKLYETQISVNRCVTVSLTHCLAAIQVWTPASHNRAWLGLWPGSAGWALSPWSESSVN